MRRFLFTLIFALIALASAAQEEKNVLEIDPASFRPIQTDALTGVNIDPIRKDRSQRPCARIKLHVNRMTPEEINQLQIHIAGGNVALTKRELAYEGNGLIIEMTAKPQTRFYLHHDRYGDSNEVTVDLAGDKEYFLDARLNLLLSIVVNSNVKGAEVYVDDRMCGVTNEEYVVTAHDITPGEHTLRVEHAGRKVEQKILVHKEKLFFRCNVDTAEANAQYVLFEVVPKNAMVLIDNEPQNTQEGFAQMVLPNGTYSYRVMAKGYHEQKGTFTVSGEKVVRKIELKADAAVVTITSAEGTEIWINNERRGTSLWSGTLSSGTYIFEARKAGHRTTTLSQTITSDRAEQSYSIEAPQPIVGAVDITSVPAMADVYLDGKNIGQTPLKTNALAGEHTIELRRKDYATKSQKITVTEGKTSSLNLTLAKAEIGGPTSSGTGYIENASCGLNMKMIWVDGGTFTMGATAEQRSDAESDEKPTHSVRLDGYYIAECEVTQAQWEAIMGNNPSSFKGDTSRPVEKVSWNDIQEFCDKLSSKTGKKYTLPTEAQWEYAARGGNKSKGYKYSGSNTIGDVAWYYDNSSSTTHPVKQKQPNELGLYDMSGNVWEWCSDWYGSYSSSSQTNPTGPSSGQYRVLRGGSWSDGAGSCRVSNRNRYDPSGRYGGYGFRVVCLP